MLVRVAFILISAGAAASSIACASGSQQERGQSSTKTKGAGGAGNEADSSIGAGDPTGLGSAGTLGGYRMRDSGTGAPLGADSACGALVLEPEAIKVEKMVEQKIDCTASVPEPIAIYIMLDNSKSMDQDGKWDNAVAAINGFVKTAPPPPSASASGGWTCVDADGKSVKAPADLTAPSAGEISVAIQYFHPINSGSDPDECDGSGHGTPAVPMGPLPANGPNITSSLMSTGPTGKTPTVGALLGGTKYCESYEAANPGKKCALVLVTDGQPNGCGLTSQCADGGGNECVDPSSADVLRPIASAAHDDPMHGVVTFTVGMSGVTTAGFKLLDSIAIAGGSDCTPGTPGHEACDVTTSGANGLLSALDTIRKSVQVTSTSSRTVTTTSTVTSTLACEWAIPKPTSGQTFDKDLVNITYTTGDVTKQLGNVHAEADCASATDGWYYDDADAPTRILTCSDTCAAIQSSTDAKVQVLIGCSTVPALIR